jgi:hypothetical protein
MNWIDTIESLRFLDTKVIDIEDFLNISSRFLFNLFMLWLIVSKIYFPKHRNKDYYFTFYLFNILVFFVCLMLSDVKLEIGFAFGIFALFSILRYRTTTLPVKEMTYLFAVVTIGVINALSNKKVSYLELVFVNFAIIYALYYLDIKWFKKHPAVDMIVYEKIENIKPENRQKLMDDIAARTGWEVLHTEVSRVNFLNDSARITVYYKPKGDDDKTSQAYQYYNGPED